MTYDLCLDLGSLTTKALRAAALGPCWPVERFNFPSGEPHVRLPEPAVQYLRTVPTVPHVALVAPGRTADDLIRIFFCVAAVRQHRLAVVDLYVPFFPCARADRETTTEPASGVVVAYLMQPHFRHTHLLDPHSARVSIAPDCKTVIRHMPHELWRRAKACQLGGARPLIVAPDRGAVERAQAAAGAGVEIVRCTKRRDPLTGKLSNFALESGPSVAGRHTLIVDDICDGGGTFSAVARMLRAAGAQTVNLVVTHGLFTKGLWSVLDGAETRIDQIFTTDSCGTDWIGGPSHFTNGRLTVVSALDEML